MKMCRGEIFARYFKDHENIIPSNVHLSRTFMDAVGIEHKVREAEERGTEGEK
jgi:hypothetical protein